MSKNSDRGSCLDLLTAPFRGIFLCDHSKSLVNEPEDERQVGKLYHDSGLLKSTTCGQCRGILKSLQQRPYPDDIAPRFLPGDEPECLRVAGKNYMKRWPNPVDLTSKQPKQNRCGLLQILNSDIRFQIWRLCMSRRCFKVHYSNGGHAHMDGILTDPPCYRGSMLLGSTMYNLTSSPIDLLFTCKAM